MSRSNDTTGRIKNGKGIYLFCVAWSHLLPVTLNVFGLDQRQAVLQWTFHGITAVFSETSLEEFCGSEAESRLKDLSWIWPRACRHEEVVQQLMSYSPVLPARFGSIFLSFDSLENLLRTHEKTISRFLGHIAGKEEWSVKGLINSEKAGEKLYSTTMAAQAEHLASLSPGVRYFEKKRIKRDIGNSLNLSYKQKLQKIAKNLDQYASDFCTRKMLAREAVGTDMDMIANSREAVGTDMDMIANWAYLVPLNFTQKFCAKVDQANKIYDQDGLTFLLSGPWPPYSFCPSLEMEKSS
jgi:hypothetical protein